MLLSIEIFCLKIILVGMLLLKKYIFLGTAPGAVARHSRGEYIQISCSFFLCFSLMHLFVLLWRSRYKRDFKSKYLLKWISNSEIEFHHPVIIKQGCTHIRDTGEEGTLPPSEGPGPFIKIK